MLKLRKSVDILSVIGRRDKEYGIKKLEKEEPIVLFCRAHDIIKNVCNGSTRRMCITIKSFFRLRLFPINHDLSG